MKRRIVKIDAEKCTGCGLCAGACHEGAIGMEDGKARLLHDDFCDGMGDCLPACPAGAISFEEREAAAYDETAVAAKKREALETRLPQPRVYLKNSLRLHHGVFSAISASENLDLAPLNLRFPSLN